MSRGKKLQEMEVDVKESNAVTAVQNLEISHFLKQEAMLLEYQHQEIAGLGQT